MAELDVQLEAWRWERRRSSGISIGSCFGIGLRSGRKTDEVGLVRTCGQTRHRFGDRATAAAASRRCFRSPGAVTAVVTALLLFASPVTPATGLVIEEPFQATFDHV